MRTRPMLAALAVLPLLLAACADDDGEAADEVTADVEEPGAELDDDTAATVNGAEIPRAEVEDRVDDAVAADDELAGQVEGEEGEQLLAMFRAQTLTILIQSQMILDGARDMGVEPTDEDIAEAREELVAEFGGEEELEAAVAQAGVSEQALEEQLRSVAALEAVAERLVEDGEVEAPEGDPEGDVEGLDELDQADIAMQQWLGEQVATAQVLVHPDYGQWDPQSGQVMPAGGPVLPEALEEE